MSKTIDQARKEISHKCDGPTTAFVVLMRAMRAIANGGDPEIYGNAYSEWLEDTGRVENMNE